MFDPLILLLVVALVACAGFASLSIYFVCHLVDTVAKLKASNNVYEFQQLQKEMNPSFRKKKERAEELDPSERSGQASTDGTLNDLALEALSSKI